MKFFVHRMRKEGLDNLSLTGYIERREVKKGVTYLIYLMTGQILKMYILLKVMTERKLWRAMITHAQKLHQRVL